MEVDRDDYEPESIVYHYLKDGILLLKARYVFETLVEDNITEVRFEDLKKDTPVELEIYIRNYVVYVFRINSNFNAWAVKIIKGHTRAIRFLYCVRYIDKGYRL